MEPLRGRYGVARLIDGRFWQGRRVFLTGHTGFKGGWLALWLQRLGAEVYGYALAPLESRGAYLDAGLECSINQTIEDIGNSRLLSETIRDFDPQVIFHLAAQPLVRKSYEDPVETFSTNLMGTVNLLEATRQCASLEAVVVVTSDKCYKNQELDHGYTEDHPLGGHDPYSCSKACAELIVASWYASFVQSEAEAGVRFGLATARAGNVIGGGDWALDRLVPDIFRSLEQKRALEVRNPDSVRPWQYVLEPLAGYLVLAQKLAEEPDKYSEPWNFGPDLHDVRSVGWLVEKLLQGLNTVDESPVIQASVLHETKRLQLDCSKAHERLNWKPVYDITIALEKICSWHRAWQIESNLHDFMIEEIDSYMRAMGLVNG